MGSTTHRRPGSKSSRQQEDPGCNPNSPSISTGSTLVGGASPDQKGYIGNGHGFDGGRRLAARKGKLEPKRFQKSQKSDTNLHNEAIKPTTRKAIPLSLSRVLTAMPLALALLPTASGIMFTKDVGLVVTDTILLAVLGWVLWGLSEGAWALYRGSVLTNYAHADQKEYQNNEERETSIEGAANDSHEFSSPSRRSERQRSKTPHSDPCKPSNSMPQANHTFLSVAGDTAAIVVALVLYLISPLLGGALLHYARYSFSSTTSLVTNFNICLYMILEFIRNMNRLSDIKSYGIDEQSGHQKHEPELLPTQEESSLVAAAQEHELRLKAQELTDYAINRACSVMDQQLDRMQHEVKSLDEKFTHSNVIVKQVLGDVVNRLERVSNEVAYIASDAEHQQISSLQSMRNSRHRRLSSDPFPRLGVLPEDDRDIRLHSHSIPAPHRNQLAMYANGHESFPHTSQAGRKPQSKVLDNSGSNDDVQQLSELVVQLIFLPFSIVGLVYRMCKNVMLWPLRTAFKVFSLILGLSVKPEQGRSPQH